MEFKKPPPGYILPEGFSNLVLTRALGQQVLITTVSGEQIFIGIAGIAKNRVRISFGTKGKSINILRMELLNESTS